jgi:hypothetical protein
VRPRGKSTHARADDGLSKPPCSRKCQHGLTYLPTGLDLASKIELRAGPQGPGARPTPHGFNVRKIRSSSPNSSKIWATSPDVSYLGLTCYTEVESNGRDAPYQTQTVCKRATWARDACAQMTVSPKPHAPKVSQHGLTYLSTGWTTRIKIVELARPQGPGAR